VGGIVKVLTLNEDRFKADIKVPAIEKYLAENLYEEFMAEMENMKKEEGGCEN